MCMRENTNVSPPKCFSQRFPVITNVWAHSIVWSISQFGFLWISDSILAEVNVHCRQQFLPHGYKAITWHISQFNTFARHTHEAQGKNAGNSLHAAHKTASLCRRVIIHWLRVQNWIKMNIYSFTLRNSDLWRIPPSTGSIYCMQLVFLAPNVENSTGLITYI